MNRGPASEKQYNDVIMSSMVSQITSLTVVYSTIYSRAAQRKHQSSASLPLCGEFTGDRSNVSIWWRHHEGTVTPSTDHSRVSSLIHALTSILVKWPCNDNLSIYIFERRPLCQNVLWLESTSHQDWLQFPLEFYITTCLQKSQSGLDHVTSVSVTIKSMRWKHGDD